MIIRATNAVVALMLRSPDIVRLKFCSALASRMRVAVRVIVLFQVLYSIAPGSRHLENEQRLADFQRCPITILPFEADDAAIAGEIRAALVAQGTPIGCYDILIAAKAPRLNATLATANTRELSWVKGLRLVDLTT